MDPGPDLDLGSVVLIDPALSVCRGIHWILDLCLIFVYSSSETTDFLIFVHTQRNSEFEEL